MVGPYVAPTQQRALRWYSEPTDHRFQYLLELVIVSRRLLDADFIVDLEKSETDVLCVCRDIDADEQHQFQLGRCLFACCDGYLASPK